MLFYGNLIVQLRGVKNCTLVARPLTLVFYQWKYKILWHSSLFIIINALNFLFKGFHACRKLYQSNYPSHPKILEICVESLQVQRVGLWFTKNILRLLHGVRTSFGHSIFQQFLHLTRPEEQILMEAEKSALFELLLCPLSVFYP